VYFKEPRYSLHGITDICACEAQPHHQLLLLHKDTVKAAYNGGGKSAPQFRNIEIIRYRYLLYKHPYCRVLRYLQFVTR